MHVNRLITNEYSNLGPNININDGRIYHYRMLGKAEYDVLKDLLIMVGSMH